MRVLVVDDDPAICELVADVVAARGHEVLAVGDGLQAWSLHAYEPFPLVLLDWMLPGLDGLEVCRRIRALPQGNLPIVVVLTARGRSDDLEAALDAGADDYLAKPFDLALLETRLRIAERRVAGSADLQRAGEELRTMSQQLWQAAKLASIGELAASVAHELNNPLAIVSLRLESLLENLAAENPSRPALEIVGQEVDRMSRLVSNLLQFSRRSAQQISTVDLVDEIDKTLELISYHLRSRRIQVVREVPALVPLIHADRQQLRQLFLNLFTNASDAMPDGGTLTIRVSEPRDGALYLEIADTGVGIPPADLPRVLEPFFTTKPAQQGTGLGLPICRRIVQEHQGTLELTSEVGQGTTVRIALPMQAGGRDNAAVHGLSDAWPPVTGQSPTSRGSEPAFGPEPWILGRPA